MHYHIYNNAALAYLMSPSERKAQEPPRIPDIWPGSQRLHPLQARQFQTLHKPGRVAIGADTLASQSLRDSSPWPSSLCLPFHSSCPSLTP